MFAAVLAGMLGCGDSRSGLDRTALERPEADAGVDAETRPTTDAGPDPTDAPESCFPPAPADRTRYAVVSHPYASDGSQARTYEVLTLSPTGALARFSPPRTFEMGRATDGRIQFTPDGRLGLVATERGKIAMFSLDADGVPTVIHDEFTGAFYAASLVIDPAGDRAIVLDSNTRENGGGLYALRIACDGALRDGGLIAAGKLPRAFAQVGDRAVVAASEMLDSSALDSDVHLLRWDAAAPPEIIAKTNAFDDTDPIVGGAALTHDGATFLVGDISAFSGLPNRVAAVAVTADGLQPIASLDVEDPASIATSPFGDVAVVASAFGDALFVLDRGGTGGAWRVRGEVPYTGPGPLLPTDLAPIDRGALRGHVLVSENVSVRQLAFRADGSVVDLGSLRFGSDIADIAGALGVTP